MVPCSSTLPASHHLAPHGWSCAYCRVLSSSFPINLHTYGCYGSVLSRFSSITTWLHHAMDLEGGYDCCLVHLHKSPTQIWRSIARRNAEARTKENRYKEETKAIKLHGNFWYCLQFTVMLLGNQNRYTLFFGHDSKHLLQCLQQAKSTSNTILPLQNLT